MGEHRVGVGVTMPAIMILGFDLEIGVDAVAVNGRVLASCDDRCSERHPNTWNSEFKEGTASRVSGRPQRPARTPTRVRSETAKEETAERPLTSPARIGCFTRLDGRVARWKDTPVHLQRRPQGGSVAAEISPELLGVGYIIGPRIASIMCAGGVLAYLVLIPAIKFFGDAIPGALAPGTIPISEMGPGQVRGAYILYIGAGAVAAGGIISLVRSLPTIWAGLKGGLRDIRGGSSSTDGKAVPRTDRDLPIKLVAAGALVLVAVITFAPRFT